MYCLSHFITHLGQEDYDDYVKKFINEVSDDKKYENTLFVPSYIKTRSTKNKCIIHETSENHENYPSYKVFLNTLDDNRYSYLIRCSKQIKCIMNPNKFFMTIWKDIDEFIGYLRKFNYYLYFNDLCYLTKYPNITVRRNRRYINLGNNPKECLFSKGFKFIQFIPEKRDKKNPEKHTKKVINFYIDENKNKELYFYTYTQFRLRKNDENNYENDDEKKVINTQLCNLDMRKMYSIWPKNMIIHYVIYINVEHDIINLTRNWINIDKDIFEAENVFTLKDIDVNFLNIYTKPPYIDVKLNFDDIKISTQMNDIIGYLKSLCKYKNNKFLDLFYWIKMAVRRQKTKKILIFKGHFNDYALFIKLLLFVVCNNNKNTFTELCYTKKSDFNRNIPIGLFNKFLYIINFKYYLDRELSNNRIKYCSQIIHDVLDTVVYYSSTPKTNVIIPRNEYINPHKRDYDFIPLYFNYTNFIVRVDPSININKQYYIQHIVIEPEPTPKTKENKENKHSENEHSESEDSESEDSESSETSEDNLTSSKVVYVHKHNIIKHPFNKIFKHFDNDLCSIFDLFEPKTEETEGACKHTEETDKKIIYPIYPKFFERTIKYSMNLFFKYLKEKKIFDIFFNMGIKRCIKNANVITHGVTVYDYCILYYYFSHDIKNSHLHLYKFGSFYEFIFVFKTYEKELIVNKNLIKIRV